MTPPRSQSRNRGPRRAAPRRRAAGAYYTRSALCVLGGISDDQLRLWEWEELVVPAAVLTIDGGAEKVYDQTSLQRIRTIRSLGEELGVNLPGIGVILNLLDRLG